MIEPNLPEFRRHMGPLVEGKTDAELAEMHATLQWVADQAIAHALRERAMSTCDIRRTA